MSNGDSVDASSLIKPLRLAELEHLRHAPEAAKLVPADITPDSESFLPEYQNNDLRLKAFMMLMKRSSKGRRARMEDVAAELGVCIDTMLLWSHRGGWRKRFNLMEREAASEEQAILDEFRRENRETELQEILIDGQNLRDAIRRKLEDADSLTPSDLQKLASALEVSAKVVSQALGLDESGSTNVEREAVQQKTPPASKPSMIVFVGGSDQLGKPVGQGQVIDI